MDGLIVDNFAGGGGASTGLRAAVGRPVDVAINHSPEAIAMHARNHPETRHFCESVWEVDPRDVAGSQRIAYVWLSPDCTHFSKAKGGQPRSKGVRSLAWTTIRWARLPRSIRPRVMFLENVEEFEDWGPLDANGMPDKERAGSTFRAFVSKLESFGYRVEWRLIVAADHGAPTTRKRLFMVARCDGKPIVWPEATHGKGRAHPWRTAAEVIDWSLPCPSIFGRRRPLADATMRRIAAGLRRYVIESAQPFIVPVKSWGGGGNGPRSIDEPMRTVTCSKRGEFGLVTPYITPVTHTHGGDRVHRIDAPLRTVTTARGGEFALVAPTLVQTGYGERPGQAPRALDIQRPLGTVVSGGKHALVTAFLAKHYGGMVGHGVERPLGTVTTQDHHSLVTAQLEPSRPKPVQLSLFDRERVEASFVSKFYGTNTGAPIDAPLPTVTATGQHLAEVRAFLVKYYGSEREGQAITDPLHTVTTKARFGLVTVHGVEYQITDIGLRMLVPRELFNAQGFPGDYVIELEHNGRPLTKTQQIELAGNSVCPDVARDIVAANLLRSRKVAA